MDLRELFAVFTVGSFKFLNDLEDPVTARHRVVDHKLQRGGIFQDHRSSHQALNPFAVACEQAQPAFLLLGIAEDTDENNSRVQVARHIDIIDRHQPRLGDREFAANDFADLALEQLAHALESKGRHGVEALER